MGYLRQSLRLLRRAPGFSLVAIAVLALGIGVNTAVFSVVNTLVLQPRPGRIDALVGVFNQSRVKADDFRDFSYPQYLDLRDRSGAFESLMAHTFTAIGVREGAAIRQSFAAVVSANYFATLGVPLAAGRPFTPDEERPGAGVPVAIASYAVWRRSGFDPHLLGSTVRINAADFTIVGIAPRGFAGTMTLVSPEWWLPLGTYDTAVNEKFKQRTTGLGDRANNALNIAGALRPGLTSAAAERALDTFARRLAADYPATDRDRALVLAALPRMAVSSRPQTDAESAAISTTLAVMAGLVLIVACLNLANLLLARGAARRREIAIRQALGSGRRRIVTQLLVEGLVLSLAGACVGVVIAWWVTAALGSWLAGTMPMGIEIVVVPSPRMALAAGGFALLSTLVFALGPAWTLSRPAVQGDLKGEPVRGGRRIMTGPVLVVAQLAMSLALVAAGGLFVRAAVNAASASPGFTLDHQLVVALDPSLAGRNESQTRATYGRVLERVRAMPGVERASLASMVPFGGMYEGRNVDVPGTSAAAIPAQFVLVSSAYFETLQLPILQGRAFTPADDEPLRGPTPVIVDTRLAQKLFAGGDPIGRAIRMPLREGEPSQPGIVLGVVPTIRYGLFSDSNGEQIYAPIGAHFRASLTMHVRTAGGSDGSMLTAIERELRQMDPALPVLSARTMRNQRDASIDEWGVRAAATLFSAFGAVALLLATVGVYGLKAYEVSRRTREIGIRVALGATRRDIARLVLSDGARTTAIGVAIGLALAAALAKLLSGMLYQVSPLDPAALVVAVAVLSAAAIAACYLPARRATRVEPMLVLRAE